MKAKKYKIFPLIALSLILGLFNDISIATIIEYPLACAGTYGFDDSWETDFDLDVEFIEIKSIQINWSGEITAGSAVKDNAPNDPFLVNVGILADLGSNPVIRASQITGGNQTYPNPETFNTTSVFKLLFDSTWSDLLDGKGNIKIYYTQPIILDGYMIETGSVLLNEAKLITHGILVPEPSTIIFITVGMLGIFRLRKSSIRNI